MKKYCMLIVLVSLTHVVFAQPINDNCTSAENIAISTSQTTINFVIADASINNEVGCSGTSDDYGDIWYEFTMPVNGNIWINNPAIMNFLALYDSCSGAQIQCGSGHTLFTNLTFGTNYKLRVFRSFENINNPNSLSFGIMAFEKPANDGCAFSQSITVSNNESTVNHNIFGASLNNDQDCTGTALDVLDIWYDFTMPVNGKLVISEADWIDTLILYDSCLGTQIQCGTLTQFSDLTAGTNYKLQLINELFSFNGISSGNNNGELSFFTVSKPSNDECNLSENINLTTSFTTVDYEIDGATIESNSYYNCSGTNGYSADIWYDFTMPIDGNLNIASAFGSENYFELYDACGGTKLYCGYERFVIHNLFVGTNYKLRLFRRADDLFEDFWDQNFEIKAVEIRQNNNCSTSENIVVSSTPLEVSTNFEGSSLNNDAGCSSSNVTNFVDLWYDFTMPVNGFIRINNIPGGGGGNFFSLYDTCNGTEIGCFYNQGNFSDLTMGTNYKLRFFDDNGTGRDEFTIESTEVLGVKNEILEETISIFPNPANDYLTISASNNQNIVAIECYDLFGEIVFKTIEHTQIDVSNLVSSLYFIKIITDKGSVTKKIIIN